MVAGEVVTALLSCPTCLLKPFSLVPDQIVEGLELAIMKHNAEETFEVTVAPEYGFGDQEVKRPHGAVPPNSQLHYIVQILEIEKVCLCLKPCQQDYLYCPDCRCCESKDFWYAKAEV